MTLPVEISLLPNQIPASVFALAGSSAQAFKLAEINRSRKGLMIYNDSVTANLLVTFGSRVASLTNFSFRLLPKQPYELPFPVFQGIVTGIFETAPATGDVVRVTES